MLAYLRVQKENNAITSKFAQNYNYSQVIAVSYRLTSFWEEARYTFLKFLKDSLARTRMYPACAAAYSNNPQACLTNAFPNAQLKQQRTVPCDPTRVDTCSGFTAVDHQEQIILVAYRGTNQQLELIMEEIEALQILFTPWVAGGHVSKFALDGFTNLWNGGMKNDFNSLKNQYPDYQVYVTGHSLVGSLAVLAASWLSHNKIVPKTQLHLITFGEPRTGDYFFSQSVDYEVPNTFRVTHAQDPVPHMPVQNFKGYRHHKTEVFYNNDMSVGAKNTVCTSSDESLFCSNGIYKKQNVDDHIKYFNVYVSDLVNSNCKL